VLSRAFALSRSAVFRPPPQDLGASPEHRLLARETREHLQNAIEALPEHQRLVLILRDVEGCSTEGV
jgi:DNA-directed RNA polymerase specialized sigma24 family protein